jgi:hypothetical protein
VRVIAIILIVAVWIRHGAIYTLSGLFGVYPWEMNWYLGGAWEAVLAAVAALLLLACPPSLWRNLGMGACAIAVNESAQSVGCGLFINDIRDVPPRTDLCDHLTGLPVGRVTMTVYLMIVCYALYAGRGKG